MEDRDKQDSYTHILKYTGIFGGVQGINILVALIRNKLVAMLLGPTGMGLLSLFNSTIRFISDSTNLGLGMSAVKDISEAHSRGNGYAVKRSIRVIRLWSLITAVAGMLICAIASPLLSRYTFGWGNHALHFLLLSPIVAMVAITGGELAILKGTQHLSALARISVYHVFAALVLSIPLFVVWRISAIVPSLVIVAFAQMVITIAYSYHYYPLQLKVNASILRKGTGMVRLGVAFLFAGLFGSGADFFIRSYINHTGSSDILGLFNAGYMIVVTFAGMVFSAMETDYFPRLSAIGQVGSPINEIVNRQIEVSLLIVSPLTAILIISLPVIIPLLYSSAFTPVVAMTQVAALALYLRSVKLPIAYLPLSRGDSAIYLLMESIYSIVFVALSICCYQRTGLLGMGIAILATALFDFIMLVLFMGYRYGYHMSHGVVCIFLQQIPIGITAYALTWAGHGALYWIGGIMLTMLSCALSIRELHQRTHLWQALLHKFKKESHDPSS